MAHMWFGDLVTCPFWDELWLNEAFATYFSYVGLESRKCVDKPIFYCKSSAIF